jgi:hypothetical protein
MRRLWRLGMVALVGVCLARGVAIGDPKVDTTDIGDNGNAAAFAVSPHVKHFLVLSVKGSRYQIFTDGVAGAKIESMDWTGGTGFSAGTGQAVMGQMPVVFSPDGEHYAYCYKDGANTVIIEDGKTVGTLPTLGGLQMPLTFSMNGQHLAWTINNMVYMDGVAGPASRYQPVVNFSPDGTRYAYVGTVVGGNQNWAVVDGKQVQYFGDISQFTPNDHLISLYPADGAGTIFVLDGKPEFKAASIQQIWTSADGKQIAFEFTPNPQAQRALSVNGKIIPGTDGVNVNNVYFSADGKRWAANCSDNGGNFMMIDGTKGDSYQQIPPALDFEYRNQFGWAYPMVDPKTAPKLPAFTSDSAKFVYVAAANAQTFLMTEDGEFDDYTVNFQNAIISPTGGHWGFIGQNRAKKGAVIIDNKPAYTVQLTPSQQSAALDFCFSPDGGHYAFIGADGQHLFEDGKELPGGIQPAKFIWSQDGKHLAYVTWNSGVAVDGKILCNPGPGHGVEYPAFSADGEHFYFVSSGNVPNSKDQQELYCDGKAVAHFSGLQLGPGQEVHYDISQNGVMTLIATSDGELTKFVVTPDSNLDAILAGAKAAPENP